MASILYEMEFLGNQMAGYSVLKDPLELVGLVIILITVVIVLFDFVVLTKNYKSTKVSSTLYWALGFGFLFITIILLLLEKVAFSVLGNAFFGEIMAIFALSTSGAALVCFAMFSFQTTYPDRIVGLTLLIAILAVIYVGTLAFAILSGPPLSDVMEYELVYDPVIDIIVYCTVLPITAIPPIVFFYYTAKMRGENIGNANRAAWMGTSLLIWAIGYIAEVAPFFPEEVSIPMRVLFIFAGLIMYVCFAMPDWFKKRIGWTE